MWASRTTLPHFAISSLMYFRSSAGDMIIGDAFIEKTLHPSIYVNYGVQAVFTVGVVVVGKLWMRRKAAKLAVEPE